MTLDSCKFPLQDDAEGVIRVERWKKFTDQNADRRSAASADEVVELAGRHDGDVVIQLERQQIDVACDQILGVAD